MQLEYDFTVPVPVSRAWAVLLDLERVAPCVPGATLTSFDGTAFTGTVLVKLGPISLTYQGKGRFVSLDEQAGQAVVEATGRDRRGAGTASMTATMRLRPAEDQASTVVNMVADLAVTGRPAQFGRGMIAEVGGKLIGQFADCLAQRLAETPPAVPAGATAPAATGPQAPVPAGDAVPAGETVLPGATVPAGETVLPGASVPATGAGQTAAAEGRTAGPGGTAEPGETPGAGGRALNVTPETDLAAATSPQPPAGLGGTTAPLPPTTPVTPTAPLPPATAQPAPPVDLLRVGAGPVLRRVAPYAIGFVAGALVTWAVLSWLG